MDNPEVIVPLSDAHWSLRLVDAKKPFPKHILANVTYKVLRFFYPPSAFNVVDLTHVVSNPELNAFNVGLFLFVSLVLPCIVYVGYKIIRKAKTPLAGNVDPLFKTTNVLMEPKWLAESNDSLLEEGFGKDDKVNDVRCRTKKDEDGDKQDDLAEQIERAVWERPVPKKQQKP